jgi:hypothetical protein
LGRHAEIGIRSDALICTPAPRDCGAAIQRPPILPVVRRMNSSLPTSLWSVEVRVLRWFPVQAGSGVRGQSGLQSPEHVRAKGDSRHADDRFSPDPADDDRFSGLCCNAMHQDFAQLRDDVGGVIRVPADEPAEMIRISFSPAPSG